MNQHFVGSARIAGLCLIQCHQERCIGIVVSRLENRSGDRRDRRDGVSRLLSASSGVVLSPNIGNFVFTLHCLFLLRCINGHRQTNRWENQQNAKRYPAMNKRFTQGGSSNVPNHFMVGILSWTGILFRGSSNTPSHFLLGML